jgi:hypothetical protein
VLSLFILPPIGDEPWLVRQMHKSYADQVATKPSAADARYRHYPYDHRYDDCGCDVAVGIGLFGEHRFRNLRRFVFAPAIALHVGFNDGRFRTGGFRGWFHAGGGRR